MARAAPRFTVSLCLAAVARHAIVITIATALPAAAVVPVIAAPPRLHLRAQRRARGSAVVVIACDLPLLTSEVVGLLANADAEGSVAVLASAAGRPQPLLARYEPTALEALLEFDFDAPMTEQVMALMPTLIDVPPEASFNVNDLQQLEEVSRRLRSSSEQAE